MGTIMKAAVIIPARMAASRFPGKPLAKILGLPMIEHVRRRVELCASIDEVIVATCDEAIRETVEAGGGRVIMTSHTHERCTDRIAEAAEQVDADIIVNVQGDEPLVNPDMIAKTVAPFRDDMSIMCVNLISPIANFTEFENPNVVKLVTDPQNRVLYLSREPIPSRAKAGDLHYPKWKQLGIIGFRKSYLYQFCRLPQTPLEIVESVDMLRAVENGHPVWAVAVEGTMIGVDVPGDILRAEQALDSDRLLERYWIK